MASKLLANIHKPIYRYLIIGISVYIFEIFIIILAQFLGANNILAIGFGFWSGLVISFILQKVITFKYRRTHHRILVPQIVAYSLLVLFNFGFTLLATQLLSDLLPVVMIRTLALGITTVWNFYLYRTKIFKTDDNPVY